MHRKHQHSQVVHFQDTGFNLGILANEAGPRITTSNSFYHSKQRTVPLDHPTDGTTRIPGKLPKADGTGPLGITEHPHQHRQCADPYRRSRKTPRSPGASTYELHQHHLKIKLDKCLFGDRQISYLGFTLTPDRIKTGEAKLKAIKSAVLPGDGKEIWSFVGLCNFFRNHIQDFAIIAAPLFKLTRQDSGYLSGPLPRAALQAFQVLQTQLSKQPALAFPRSDQNYLLITNAYTPDQNLPGGLCTTLAQRDEHGRIKIISHSSRQLKENKKNYMKFLLETGHGQFQRVP
jgi:hypothetical protein